MLIGTRVKRFHQMHKELLSEGFGCVTYEPHRQVTNYILQNAATRKRPFR